MSLLQHPHFRPRHYLGGSAVIFFIVLLYGFSLSAVFSVGSDYALSDFLKDDYLHQVIAFSVGQAFLSALLSSIIGILFARAFFYFDFKGKSLILRIFSLTFVLPALLAIFGLIGIYGTAGWLTQLLQTLGISWKPSIYGLSGILIAHLFFNIPLAARMSLQALQSVPTEQHQLAAQLNIKGFTFFRLIEWPYLKSQIVSAFVLIFMLCFTSFTIVLALGGGPQNSTLEVAIYQAIFFEFDLPKAAFFALVQFAFCFALFSLSQYWVKAPETQGFTCFKCGQIWASFYFIFGVLIYFKSLIQYRFPRFVCDPIVWLLAKSTIMESTCLFINHGSNRRGFIGIICLLIIVIFPSATMAISPEISSLNFNGGHDDFSHSDDRFSSRLIPLVARY